MEEMAAFVGGPDVVPERFKTTGGWVYMLETDGTETVVALMVEELFAAFAVDRMELPVLPEGEQPSGSEATPSEAPTPGAEAPSETPVLPTATLTRFFTKSDTSWGRPRRLHTYRRHFMYVAGVDIGGTNLKFGVFDENGQPVYTLLRRTARGGPEAIASQIAALLSASPTPAEMVGAGVPGSVFRPSGKINSGNLKWFGIPFGALLREKTGLPVWIDNDAEAALAAETLPGGSCFGLESAVYLTLGTGIGGALLINGRPWRGHDNAAAELGHFVTHAGGLKCACGMNGCFEMYASAAR